MWRNREIFYAVAAMALVTAFYGATVTRLQAVPAASGLVGHGLGIAGFTLMLMTETLYSLRKRSRWARWGRMSSWLRFHIFTGLVGPYMVLLHAAWRFNGLAGAAMAMSLVVVVSGIVGRYIYTAVPRNADGLALQAEELQAEIDATESRLRQWLAAQPEPAQAQVARLAALPNLDQSFASAADVRGISGQRRQLTGVTKAQARELDGLMRQRRSLQRQMASAATTRRMLAVWHAVHVPLGLALFTLAFVHTVAAIYYATLLR
ncbi:MAG: hypothetical protein ACYC5O_17185 [Anaerolineae bacterium]